GCLDTLFCQPTPVFEEKFDELEVKIYPNPADEMLTIEAKNGFQAGDALLIDLQGKIILKQPLPNAAGQLTLSTAHLAPGIYFMTIQTSSGTLHRFKILIAH
ncbi:MAG: T9SS type A sorting domain-containing protein, partial [Bacteroidota bacterium]